MRELAAKKEKLVNGISDAIGDRGIRRWDADERRY